MAPSNSFHGPFFHWSCNGRHWFLTLDSWSIPDTIFNVSPLPTEGTTSSTSISKTSSSLLVLGLCVRELGAPPYKSLQGTSCVQVRPNVWNNQQRQGHFCYVGGVHWKNEKLDAGQNGKESNTSHNGLLFPRLKKKFVASYQYQVCLFILCSIYCMHYIILIWRYTCQCIQISNVENKKDKENIDVKNIIGAALDLLVWNSLASELAGRYVNMCVPVYM